MDFLHLGINTEKIFYPSEENVINTYFFKNNSRTKTEYQWEGGTERKFGWGYATKAFKPYPA